MPRPGSRRRRTRPHRGGAFEFIDANRATFPVVTTCTLLGVSDERLLLLGGSIRSRGGPSTTRC